MQLDNNAVFSHSFLIIFLYLPFNKLFFKKNRINSKSGVELVLFWILTHFLLISFKIYQVFVLSPGQLSILLPPPLIVLSTFLRRFKFNIPKFLNRNILKNLTPNTAFFEFKIADAQDQLCLSF